MGGSEKRLNLKCGVLWVSRRERSSLLHTFLSQHDEAWRAQRAAVTHAHPPRAMKTTVTILACLRDQKQNGKCYSDIKKHDVTRRTYQIQKLKTNIACCIRRETPNLGTSLTLTDVALATEANGSPREHSPRNVLQVTKTRGGKLLRAPVGHTERARM